ncbi:two-component sensor histidine kinase [Cupriavidus sp. USMAHM13]|uniref:histidine kinase n=1 Tax=Cupriavidus malaysiensis TaxID=367825 RepID=A0ABM6FAD3_9BURK|nr:MULTISPECIES: HAMP domain-containing sensor histidine kinase [Cupriavidus]AOZ01658.1 two-component sensor histidine kinase [Cupriavidus sp. USMAHM13]AOZ08592.1 two-component sensor histidine kinase [Cupriavidus malaysiensis]
MRNSLRFKVALAFSAVTILLLIAQALGVKTLAEAQEERLIDALIQEDIGNLLQSYRSDPALLPPFDRHMNGYVSGGARQPVVLPAAVKDLPLGTHEILVGGQEIHVAVAPFGNARLYRVYDFGAYEQRFKQVINALMAGTGVFALLTIWLAYALSGLLVRQVGGLARQVKALRLGDAASVNPGRYDEAEVAELASAFNAYHQRMSSMVEREKSFTGNVSHELRTPLTIVKTGCELLDQDDSIRGKSRVRLQQIERAADTMREVIEALLMLAREASAEHQEPVNMADMARTALAPFADSLAAKDVEAMVDIDPGQHVTANRPALAIVLSNLVDNAVRHTAQGHIRFSYEDGRLALEDTGAGISPQALPHVFERLYQAGPEEARASGCGIGLAIVKRICDQYGWAIELDSELGRGTRASLRFAPTPASDAS